MHRLFLSDLFIHHAGIVLADIVSHLQDLNANCLGAELNLQLVADLYIIRCLGRPSVDHDPGVVAGLIGHSAPLDQPGGK